MDEDWTFVANEWSGLFYEQEKLGRFVRSVRINFTDYPPDKKPVPLCLSYELVANVLSFMTGPKLDVDDVEVDKEILNLRLVSKTFAAAGVDVLLRKKPSSSKTVPGLDIETLPNRRYVLDRSREIDYHLMDMCFLTNYKSMLPTPSDFERFAQVVSSPYGKWGSLITDLDFVLKRDHFEVLSPSWIDKLSPELPSSIWRGFFMDMSATEYRRCSRHLMDPIINAKGIRPCVLTGNVFRDHKAVPCPIDDGSFLPHRMQSNRNMVQLINSMKGRKMVSDMLASMPNLKRVRIGAWPMFTNTDLRALSKRPDTRRSSEQYKLASRHFFKSLRFMQLCQLILGPVDPEFFGEIPLWRLKQVSFAQSLKDLDITIVRQSFDSISDAGAKRWHAILNTCGNLERLSLRFSAFLNDAEYLEEWWMETILANQHFKYLKEFEFAEFKIKEVFLTTFLRRHRLTLEVVILDALLLKETRRLRLLHTLRKMDLEQYLAIVRDACACNRFSCICHLHIWCDLDTTAWHDIVEIWKLPGGLLPHYATGQFARMLPRIDSIR